MSTLKAGIKGRQSYLPFSTGLLRQTESDNREISEAPIARLGVLPAQVLNERRPQVGMRAELRTT